MTEQQEKDLDDAIEQQLAPGPKAGAARPPSVLDRTSASVESALASLLAHRADLERQINELHGKRVETDRAILALKTAIGVINR